MKKGRKETVICLAFLLVLYALWAVDFLYPDRLYSDWEKRMLAQRPALNRTDVLNGDYGKNYEEWLTDQFPLRDQWVSVKTRCELLLQKKKINGIYVGKDGQLFSDQERIADWDRLETQMRNQYGALNVSRIRVPAAGAVLTDRMPRGLSFPFVEDRIWENLYRHREEYIYYRTDHHWTMLGAYYAYEAWAEEQGLVPVPPEKLERKTVKEDFLGTHYARLHYAEKADAIDVYDPGVSCQVVYDLGESDLQGLYQTELLDSEDAYRYFLDGNHPVLQIETGQGEGHLAVLKDSFANCMVPYLACHYGKITVIDPRYFRTDISAWLQGQEVTKILIVSQDTVKAE